MTVLVPFDGSDLSRSALVRATTLGDAFDERVLAVSVIPKGNASYARERDWIGPDEEYDAQAIVDRLREQVADVAPRTDFRHEFVSRHASAGTIAQKVRATAREAEVTLVAIGSDNAGRLVSSLHSVGSSVAADRSFDVFIVRREVPVETGSSGGRSAEPPDGG